MDISKKMSDGMNFRAVVSRYSDGIFIKGQAIYGILGQLLMVLKVC
jgi:hypothetical protein